MRKMKDSGVAWLESIPETWNLLQLGSLFLEHKHKNVGMQSSNLLSLSYGKIIQKNINATDGLLPESFEGYNVIDAGDIVLRLTDLQNDQRSLRVGLCGESGIITSAYTTLRRRNDALNSKYFYYLLHSYDIRKGFYGMGAGVRQGLNYAGVRKIMLTVPPESEQTAIAECLDRKTAQVDALIANVQAQIEKLKAYKQSLITEVVIKGLDPNVPMRDSGVEWIGKIPKHYDVIRMRYLINNYKAGPFGSALITDQLQSDGDILCYTPEHIANQSTESNKNLYLPENRRKEMSQFFVSVGDIIFPIVGSLGRAMVITSDMPAGIINQRLAKFSIDAKKMDINYFMWLFAKSSFFHPFIDLFQRGSIIVNLTKAIIYDMPMIVPPTLEEQKIIASYLDTKCAEIDQLIAVKQSKIEKLEQYKRSLIYEYVTGKKEIC